MKTIVVAALGCYFMLTTVFAAEPTVTDVTAKQRYPWNGLVDITCKVSGINGTTNGLKFAMAAVMPDSGNARYISHFWVVQGGTNSIDRKVRSNGNYRLLWDARADLNQIVYSNMVVRVTIDAHDKVQLWEGGPYWATTNIGAEEPWEYGYYFWWGDTVGYKNEGNIWVASDGSYSNFHFYYKTNPICGQTFEKSFETLLSEGWITADGVLAPEHDAAQIQWGGGWRIPTYQELNNLIVKCDWNWTTINGVNGYVVRGKGDYESASIFLPCAGYGYGSGNALLNVGSEGDYHSSVLQSYVWDYRLYFSSAQRCISKASRDAGHSIRPVQGSSK